MNVLLWVLQGATAILFGASGVMKAFMFDEVSADVPSFGALPRAAWTTLGIVELVCAIALVAPAVLRRHTRVAVVAAAVLALETMIFVWVHVQYREVGPMIMSGALGLVMAFIAWGRATAKPS